MESVAVPPATEGNYGSGAKRRSGSAVAESAWIWSVVGYSVLRFLIAWGAFGEHGVNPWIFGIIDVGTAWPYAKSVANVSRRSAYGEWSRLPGPVTAAFATFMAPYAYVWMAAGSMPAGLRTGLILAVAVLAVAAALGVTMRARRMRNELEVVIDLTDETPAIVRRPAA